MEKIEKLTNQHSNAALENREDTIMKIWEIKANVLRCQLSQSLLDDISDVFLRSGVAFGLRREEQLKELEQYKNNEHFYNRLMARLNKECDIFFETTDELLEGLIKGLKKRLEDGSK